MKFPHSTRGWRGFSAGVSAGSWSEGVKNSMVRIRLFLWPACSSFIPFSPHYHKIGEFIRWGFALFSSPLTCGSASF